MFPFGVVVVGFYSFVVKVSCWYLELLDGFNVFELGGVCVIDACF